MANETICPRCGHKNSFLKGFLPDTCVCRVCQSQLDWREIPGAGADCGPAADEKGVPDVPMPAASQEGEEDHD